MKSLCQGLVRRGLTVLFGAVVVSSVVPALAQGTKGPPFDEKLWQMRAGNGTIYFRCTATACPFPAMASVQFSQGDRNRICEQEAAQQGRIETGGQGPSGTILNTRRIRAKDHCGYTRTIRLDTTTGSDELSFAVLHVTYRPDANGPGARVSVVSTSSDLKFAQRNADIFVRWLAAGR